MEALDDKKYDNDDDRKVRTKVKKLSHEECTLLNDKHSCLKAEKYDTQKRTLPTSTILQSSRSSHSSFVIEVQELRRNSR